MAIMPLDDRTYCARSVFSHLGLSRKLNDYSQINSLDIVVYLQPFGCNFKEAFSISMCEGLGGGTWDKLFDSPQVDSY